MIKLFTVLGILILYIIITGIGGVIAAHVNESSDYFFAGAYITSLLVFVVLSMYIVGRVSLGI
jgi:hypothetical protein